MLTIEASDRFKKAYRQLPRDIQKKTHKALCFLAKNPHHPSLQSKLIQGIEGIFEARVDRSYRMTYMRLPGNKVLIRTVGKHDETFENP